MKMNNMNKSKMSLGEGYEEIRSYLKGFMRIYSRGKDELYFDGRNIFGRIKEVKERCIDANDTYVFVQLENVVGEPNKFIQAYKKGRSMGILSSTIDVISTLTYIFVGLPLTIYAGKKYGLTDLASTFGSFFYIGGMLGIKVGSLALGDKITKKSRNTFYNYNPKYGDDALEKLINT